MQGYSGTPLAKKLGVKGGCEIVLIDAPAHLRSLLEPLPPDVRFADRILESTDLVHIFATQRAELDLLLRSVRVRIRPNAAVWVSWPKKSAKVATDITEDVVREVALPLGFVDIKVCAVDDVWSGLKLVVRKELR
jgi:hypothetical protein